ncbi:MAG: hypothetical protein R3E95_02785 [Thiolinea sp.]
MPELVGCGTDALQLEQEKGVYLARLIRQQRTLLVLDGLEVFSRTACFPNSRTALMIRHCWHCCKPWRRKVRACALNCTASCDDERIRRYSGVVEHKLNNLSPVRRCNC